MGYDRDRYVDDPGNEAQTGNMTWQIPDPRRPEHWRHTENPCMEDDLNLLNYSLQIVICAF